MAPSCLSVMGWFDMITFSVGNMGCTDNVLKSFYPMSFSTHVLLNACPTSTYSSVSMEPFYTRAFMKVKVMSVVSTGMTPVLQVMGV